MKTLYVSVAAIALTGTAAFAANDMMADTNGDGFVTQEEAMATFPEMSKEDFALIDENNDGRLDMDEVRTSDAQQILNKYTPASADTTVKDVADLDTNGDSFLSQEELMAGFPGVSKEEFDMIDTNNDNRVSSEELYASDAQNILNEYRTNGTMVADMSMFDTNGDGFASEAEIAAVFPTFSEVDFSDMDENNDNRISSEEMQQAASQDLLKRYM